MRNSDCPHRADLQSKIDRFEDYDDRHRVVHEVWMSEHLIQEDWELNFIVDFHQLYRVAYPRVVDIDVTVVDGRMRIAVKSLPKEAQARVFRDRVRKAIPFFGTVRVKPPLLIPPYRLELEAVLHSRYQQVIRSRVASRILGMGNKITELLSELRSSVGKLEAPAPKGGDVAEEQVKEVEKFADLTRRGFYVLCAADAAGTTTLRRIFDDGEKRHVRKLSKEDTKAIEGLESGVWYEPLCRLRDEREFSNYVDAYAIASVLRLNEKAAQEDKRVLYFLLSDAPALRQLLRSGADFIRNPRRKWFPDVPRIRHPQLPSFCPQEGLAIQRTSYHFEEAVRAFDPNWGAFYANLEQREQELGILAGLCKKVKAVRRKCRRCSAENERACEQLRDDIDEFLKKERDLEGLEQILEKEKAFQPLLEFMKSMQREDPSKKVRELATLYNKIFAEDYDDMLKTRLRTTLERYESEYRDNLGSISLAAAATAATAPHEVVMYKLRRMYGIVFEVAFHRNRRITNLLRKVLSGDSAALQIDEKAQMEWFLDAFGLVARPTEDPETALLATIFLYCFGFYVQAAWQATRWIKEKAAILETAGLEVEFHYMYVSALAREAYGFESNDKAIEVCRSLQQELTRLSKKHPNDPRIPHLSGKIIGRLHEFGKDTRDVVLDEALDCFRDARRRVDESPAEQRFKILELPLLNNELYTIVSRSQKGSADSARADELYATIISHPKLEKSQHLETLASYEHAMFLHVSEPSEQETWLGKAIQRMRTALRQAEVQYVDEQQVKTFTRKYDRWRKEYTARFGKRLSIEHSPDEMPRLG